MKCSFYHSHSLRARQQVDILYKARRSWTERYASIHMNKKSRWGAQLQQLSLS
jgi:hypothetical protein